MESLYYDKYTFEEFMKLSFEEQKRVARTWQIKFSQKCIENKDYETIFFYAGNSSLYGYTATDMLDIFYDCIPDDQKYKIVLDVYVNAKFATKRLSKYIKDIKKYRPNCYADLVKELADDKGYLTVYRGGTKTSAAPEKAISWSTNIDVAKFFAYRFEKSHGAEIKGELYSGEINIKNIIAYTNDRQEHEIIQYRSVENIKTIR